MNSKISKSNQKFGIADDHDYIIVLSKKHRIKKKVNSISRTSYVNCSF